MSGMADASTPMNGLRPYPQMKDSGVECLGDVPAHWEVRRLRNLVEMRASNVDKHVRDDEEAVRLCNYVDVYHHDHIHSDMNFMAATATAAEVDRFRLRKGDVLITKDSEDWTDIGVPAIVEEAADDVLCGYHLALLRPRVDVKGEFLLRGLQGNASALQFRVRANGVTRYGLSHNAIKSVWLPVPPLPEQTAIARFLDHATSRIERYIRAKEALIPLREEWHRTFVQQAVTGQIDVRTGEPYADYKPSGVEWLGDVPRHWEIRKVRQCGTITGGMTPSMANRGYWDGEIPWVTPKDMKVDVVERSAIRVSGKALVETPLRLLPSRVVLLVVRGMILARRVPIAVTGEMVTINQDMKAVSPKPGVLPEYLASQMASAQDALLAMTDEAGHGTRRLPTVRWRDLGVCIPPSAEQQEIVGRVASNQASTAATIAEVTQQVESLREYRTQLVADVVTGKLDVRDAAARLPNEPEDPSALDREHSAKAGKDRPSTGGSRTYRREEAIPSSTGQPVRR